MGVDPIYLFIFWGGRRAIPGFSPLHKNSNKKVAIGPKRVFIPYLDWIFLIGLFKIHKKTYDAGGENFFEEVATSKLTTGIENIYGTCSWHVNYFNLFFGSKLFKFNTFPR